MFSILEPIESKLIKACKSVPFLQRVFRSDTNEFVILKVTFGFIYGASLSYLVYNLVLMPMLLNSSLTLGITSFIGLFLSLGFAFSPQFRCTAILLTPTLFSKAGQKALRALVIVYVLAGPTDNMLENSYQVVNTFACSTAQTHNLTKLRNTLLFQPFENALLMMKGNKSYIEGIMKSLNDVFSPLSNEFEDDVLQLKNSSVRLNDLNEPYVLGNKSIIEGYELFFKKQLNYYCQGLLSACESRCKNIFKESYNDCLKNATSAIQILLCRAMLLHHICNFTFELPKDVCSSDKVIPKGFGLGYDSLKTVVKTLSMEVKEISVKYSLNFEHEKNNSIGPVEAATATVTEFLRKRDIVILFYFVIKCLLALSTLKVFFSAQNYHVEYLQNIEFQNYYITNYFRKIDARRHKIGKYTLFPMMKMEKEELVDLKTMKFSSIESVGLFRGTCKIVAEATGITTILIVDNLLYQTMKLVRNYSIKSFCDTGKKDVTLTVRGSGAIAKVLEAVVEEYMDRGKLEITINNLECLPRPQRTGKSILKKIYGVYLTMLLMATFKGYINRARMGICAYFYPKRQKKRILYLYNETLKKRYKFTRDLVKKIVRIVRRNKINDDLNLLLQLRLRYPQYLYCLRWLPKGRRRCLVCGEVESYRSAMCRVIKCPQCSYIYCEECWRDVEEICYVCFLPPIEDDDIS